MDKKLTLERASYNAFLAKYAKGAYGSQRLGQAFYDEFKLYRLVNQSTLNNVYEKDGDHAVRCIEAIFTFN